VPSARYHEGFRLPGTSELALCQAFAALGHGILVNSRGDREAVFMAGGSGLSGRPEGLAIVHGARGLTNAAGAIGDLRRNELPALVIVGLPSTASARFLPPHGEDGLLASVGAFAKDARQLGWSAPSQDLAVDPVQAIDAALAVASALPRGPVLLGGPQDILEARVVPADSLARSHPADIARPPAGRAMRRARVPLRGAKSPLILIDDYLLRHHDAQEVLAHFAERLDTPIYQVRYRRGPMLFQQLTGTHTPRFAGFYDPDRPEHRHRMATADLLVTVEDRNIYQRVVGQLPSCPKIAITSNPDKAKRNEYLAAGDVIIDGDPILAVARLTADHAPRPAPVVTEPDEDGPDGDGQSDDNPTRTPREQLQRALTEVVRGCLALIDARHVVDDSQMAGGMLAAVYEQAFGDATVVGDHAGFVGAGIPLAGGLAVTIRLPVLCLLGDQGFTNGSQGLVCAAQETAPVLYVVCNNGESVSLRQQAAAQDLAGPAGDFDRLLRIPPDYSYVATARAAGIPATQVDLDRPQGTDATAQVLGTVQALWSAGGPALIELRLPGAGPAWDGVWSTRGFDDVPPDGASSPPPRRRLRTRRGGRR
jgi:acetolactate synthase-1/2/3 large subunit